MDKMLKMNLQIFAEEAQPQTEPAVEETTEETIQMTKAEYDRQISQLFEKWSAKSEKEKEKIKAEAEKLASMNAEEKARYEIEQIKAEAEMEKEELKKIKIEALMDRNRAECVKILAEDNKHLAGIADLVVAQDAESMKKNIDKLKQAFRLAVNEEANKRLKSKLPMRDYIDNGVLTKEQFNKMSLEEQNHLYKTNKELWEELSKK